MNGPIPAELGRLTNLQRLSLRNNKLSGPIPAELGRLTEVWRLSLNDNELTGPIPPELGGMAALRVLLLYNNTGMSGQLPAGLTRLGQLEQLMAGGTGLCAPSDPGILNWLDGVPRQRLEPCGIGAAPPAYLTQAVQSRRYPVPLVAGEEALLRVFVTASDAGGARVPPVRARFYVDGRERHVVDIPAGSTPIPSEVDEGSFKASANARVPADVVQPGLEWVVEIDPDGMLGPGLGLTRRIPESGRWPVDVREMPVFNLTVIPFVQSSEPDTSIVELVEAMAADPEGHELLWDTRTLLPIRDLDVTAHESVMVSTNNAFGLLAETEMIRAMEGAGGHYMGTIAGPVSGGAAGVANLGGKDSFVTPDSSVIAHELGHNFGLDHAPCGVLADATYPHDDGSIGAWGYDFREGGRIVSPETPDLMSYCRPRWIGDYHFSNALRFRLRTAAPEGAPQNRRSGAIPSAVGRPGRRRRSVPGTGVRGGGSGQAAGVGGRPPDRRTCRRWHGAVLAGVRDAGGSRRRRRIVLRLHASHRAGLGRGFGRRHALRARRRGHDGRGHEPPGDHSAQSADRAGSRRPARRAGRHRASGRYGTGVGAGAGCEAGACRG